MKSLIAFVALFAAIHALGDWKGGLKVRFGLNPLGIGSKYFVSIPQTVSEAKNAHWVETPRPEGPMPSLVLYCPSLSDRVLCALYDDTDYIAGLQVALPQDSFEGGIFDWGTQGFTQWTPPAASVEEVKAYWAIQQFYVSEETLAVSAAERLAKRNKNKLLQEGSIWVTSFNGELMEISTDAEKIADSASSHFTKQACIPLMGRHYYYNMTAVTTCTADAMLPWFPLVHSGELIGLGFVSMGKLSEDSLVKDYFERPTRSNVELIVPNGPDCLYELAENTGMTTMHTYFVDHPWLIGCLFQ